MSTRPRIAVWVAVPTLVVMAAFIAILAFTDDGDAPSPLLGRQAPPIESTTIDGEAFSLDDYRGQFVIVNFFAPWCIPCVREHPELDNFQRRHAAAGDAELVSVVFDAEVESVREFFADNGGDWPVATDDDQRIALDWGVTGLPESYLVAPDGIVLTKITGGVTAADLDALLAQAQGQS